MKDEDGYFYIDDYGRKCRSEDDETDVDARPERCDIEDLEGDEE